METTENKRHFVSLGMFIIDEIVFEDGTPTPESRTSNPQIGGGGTYASIGARIWLPAEKVGMIVDRGPDFPDDIQRQLEDYGSDMWLFRDGKASVTTRALNIYKGDTRGFQYLTPRIRITPRDLEGTKLERPTCLHFICSPSRAVEIMSEVHAVKGWHPITIFEPIPDRCIPEELPALIGRLIMRNVSPNADEALSLLSMKVSVSRASVEEAANRFLDIGVGSEGRGSIIIRSGALGAYIMTRGRGGRWVDPFWTAEDASRVVDVTGAGNAFLGGLSAGLLAEKDVYKAALYATVSSSFVIEQEGLPRIKRVDMHGSDVESWNGELPFERLARLKERIHE
ncbi:Ribokinase-like protein [Panus rudis PR-1116 ss-1]|nr:Ribokinase-like protein [Panus rudis PR-1116 ss-1]